MPKKKIEESPEVKKVSTRTKKGTIRKKPWPKAKPWPKWLDREKVLQKLKKYLQLDLSINRACNAYNADEYERSIINWKPPEFISAQTVREWVRNDEEFRWKIEFYQDTPNVMARQVWREKIAKWDYQASKEWLERRERIEFSTKLEMSIEWNIQTEMSDEDKEMYEKILKYIKKK